MKQVLYCRKCGNALSNTVEMLGRAESLLPSGRGRIGTDLVREGEAFLSSKPFLSSVNRSPFETDKVPQYWLSVYDITESNVCVDQSSFVCCGLNGRGSWNVSCAKCKEKIGSEMSDCMVANFFIANPDTTLLHEPIRTYQEKLDFFRLKLPRKRHKK